MKEIERLRHAQSEQRARLRKIVQEAMDEEVVLTQNLGEADEEITVGQRWADMLSNFGGSWKFIAIFLIVITIWVAFNVLAVSLRFDPYPFILMNLFLSCIAALQAPVIMMSQNRKEARDRKRAENDFMTNLKAEMEIRSLHQKIDLLIGESMRPLYESQANQLSLLKEIDKKVNLWASGKGEDFQDIFPEDEKDDSI